MTIHTTRLVAYGEYADVDDDDDDLMLMLHRRCLLLRLLVSIPNHYRLWV